MFAEIRLEQIFNHFHVVIVMTPTLTSHGSGAFPGFLKMGIHRDRGQSKGAY